VTETAAEGTLSERVAVVRSELIANAERLSQARGQLRETRQSIAQGRSRRQQLHDLVIARLLAQLESMPTIEQAKGILIAQTGCDPDAAFGMLREASQRSNVRVSELAAMIVQRTATGRRPPGPVAADSREAPDSPGAAPRASRPARTLRTAGRRAPNSAGRTS